MLQPLCLFRSQFLSLEEYFLSNPFRTKGTLWPPYPEFKPTKENWARLCLYLEGAGVKANSGVATFEDMEAAFHYLKPLGGLELNNASVRLQEARAINDRNEARERAAAFNEEEAYALPLNEVARRARGW